MEILVDFDGTCVTHEFPKVGREIGAVRVLKKLVEKGHNLILFTMRADVENVPSPEQDGLFTVKSLTDAVDWFKKHDIPLYGVNVNPTQHVWTTSPKAYGQLIIDDISLGVPLIHPGNVEGEFGGKIYLKATRPYVDWHEVEKILIKDGVL